VKKESMSWGLSTVKANPSTRINQATASTVLSDGEFAGVARGSTNSRATDTPTGSRQVATSDQAFTGCRAVIQVNQSAGVGN
jgi:hypothetical protein